jgi:hypothetical protein
MLCRLPEAYRRFGEIYSLHQKRRRLSQLTFRSQATCSPPYHSKKKNILKTLFENVKRKNVRRNFDTDESMILKRILKNVVDKDGGWIDMILERIQLQVLANTVINRRFS